ncbi:MAG: Lrp/AsnC family transcriptional regulator [Actinomycetota bacterium]
MGKPSPSRELDDSDRALIRLLRTAPGISGAELARRTGMARNTVQMRLKRLRTEGAITGFGPDVSPAAAGLQVLAFVALTIAQGEHDRTITALTPIDEILEIHTVTGDGDLLLKVVARTNDDLHRIVQRIAGISTVARTDTRLSLDTSLHRTVADLIVNTEVD